MNATEQLYGLVGDDELFDIINDIAKDPDVNIWDDERVQNRLEQLGVYMVTPAEPAQEVKENHDEDCQLCHGTGEGLYDGESCPHCHGSGIEPRARDDDDFDEPDDDFGDYGDEESYYEKSLRSRGLGEQQGVAEGAGDIGSKIKALYQQIYDQGDDAIEFMYNDSPIFAQYWDEYEGDLDSIIAEVNPNELQVIAAELESAVEDQGLEECGNYGMYEGPDNSAMNTLGQFVGSAIPNPKDFKKGFDKTFEDNEIVRNARKLTDGWKGT